MTSEDDVVRMDLNKLFAFRCCIWWSKGANTTITSGITFVLGLEPQNIQSLTDLITLDHQKDFNLNIPANWHIWSLPWIPSQILTKDFQFSEKKGLNHQNLFKLQVASFAYNWLFISPTLTLSHATRQKLNRKKRVTASQSLKQSNHGNIDVRWIKHRILHKGKMWRRRLKPFRCKTLISTQRLTSGSRCIFSLTSLSNIALDLVWQKTTFLPSLSRLLRPARRQHNLARPYHQSVLMQSLISRCHQ